MTDFWEGIAHWWDDLLARGQEAQNIPGAPVGPSPLAVPIRTGIPYWNGEKMVVINPDGTISDVPDDADSSTGAIAPWIALGAGTAAILGSGALYRLSRRKTKKKALLERQERTAEALDAFSANASKVLLSMGPIIALPFAYIAVQEAKNHRLITHGLGNDVQTLIGVSAGGSLLSGLGSIVKAVV